MPRIGRWKELLGTEKHCFVLHGQKKKIIMEVTI